MEAMKNYLRDTVDIVIAVLIVAIAVLMISFFIGICAGAVHLGYVWGVS